MKPSQRRVRLGQDGMATADRAGESPTRQHLSRDLRGGSTPPGLSQTGQLQNATVLSNNKVPGGWTAALIWREGEDSFERQPRARCHVTLQIVNRKLHSYTGERAITLLKGKWHFVRLAKRTLYSISFYLIYEVLAYHVNYFFSKAVIYPNMARTQFKIWKCH